MSVSGVNGTDPRALFHQRRLDFKALTDAVDAGDPAAAQAALQNYQKDVQSIQSALGPADSTSSSGFATQIKTDLSSLTAAVQSGNMTDAQTALAAYEQDRNAQFQPAPQQGDDASSTLAKDLTNLVQAVQSGDASKIQSSGAALAKDIQSLSQAGGPGGAHHHHHHHHAGPPPTDSDATTETSLLGNTGDQTGDATTASASGSASDDPQSAAVAEFIKQFTNALEQFEQTTPSATV